MQIFTRKKDPPPIQALNCISINKDPKIMNSGKNKSQNVQDKKWKLD